MSINRGEKKITFRLQKPINPITGRCCCEMFYIDRPGEKEDNNNQDDSFMTAIRVCKYCGGGD
jgi:hypothetical protein